MSNMSTAPVSAPADTDSRALAKRHLLQQLDLGAEAARTGRRELGRLADWVDERQDDLLYGTIDRGCGHTARLIGAIARLANAQTASALALAKLDAPDTVHRVVVERRGGGEGA